LRSSTETKFVTPSGKIADHSVRMTGDTYLVKNASRIKIWLLRSRFSTTCARLARYSEPRIPARFRFISATRELWSWPRRVTTLVARISIKVSAANREMVGV
jgi:hypothetical protein